jgi:integral membrane protein
VADFAGDPTTELERKLGPFKVVCIIETISYLTLLAVWQGRNYGVGTAIVGSIHGMIFTAFALMMLVLYRPMGWTWKFLAVGIGLGPIGAVIVYERVRRTGAPAPTMGT